MRTLDPNIEHAIATAREQLRSQLIYLESTLKETNRVAPIYGLLFSIIDGQLHYGADPACGMPTEYGVTEPAYELLTIDDDFEYQMLTDTAQAIMNWFTNPTYQD